MIYIYLHSIENTNIFKIKSDFTVLLFPYTDNILYSNCILINIIFYTFILYFLEIIYERLYFIFIHLTYIILYTITEILIKYLDFYQFLVRDEIGIIYKS